MYIIILETRTVLDNLANKLHNIYVQIIINNMLMIVQKYIVFLTFIVYLKLHN